MDIKAFLLRESEEGIAKFASKLITTKSPIYGVKLPKLRQFVKNMTPLERLEYLDCGLSGKSYEEILLYGFILGVHKFDYEDFLLYFNKFIPFVDNWSTCDSPLSSMKIIAKNCNKFLVVIDNLLFTNENFYQRIGFVALLNFYVNQDYLDVIFDYCDRVISTNYYVNMAKAWLLSVCYVKHGIETLEYLKKNSLDDFTHNKTIAKICDSLRVSDDEKSQIRLLKR